MTEVNKRYFDGLLRDRDMTLRGLARLMGMSHSQLSLTFSGQRRLKIEEAAQLAQVFNEPLHNVVEAAGISVRGTDGDRVSVVGFVRGDGTVELHEAGVIERTGAPPGLPSDSIAVQWRTTGSPLAFADGWVSFSAKPRGVESGITGRLCLAKITDGPTVVATVSRGYREGTWNLHGFFSAESVTLESATPVLWSRH